MRPAKRAQNNQLINLCRKYDVIIHACARLRKISEVGVEVHEHELAMAEKLDAVTLNNVNWLLIRRCPQVPVRYQTIPSLVTENAKLPPRLFPYNLPIGPRRPFSVISRPPALGIGNIRGLEENKKNELSTEESSGTFPPTEIESKSEKELQVLRETVS